MIKQRTRRTLQKRPTNNKEGRRGVKNCHTIEQNTWFPFPHIMIAPFCVTTFIDGTTYRVFIMYHVWQFHDPLCSSHSRLHISVLVCFHWCTRMKRSRSHQRYSNQSNWSVLPTLKAFLWELRFLQKHKTNFCILDITELKEYIENLEENILVNRNQLVETIRLWAEV